MGRKRDPVWDKVEELRDGKWRCKRCRKVFSGGAWRMKGHVYGIAGQGISVCEVQVMDDHTTNPVLDYSVRNSEQLTGPSTNTQEDFSQLQYSIGGNPSGVIPVMPLVDDMLVLPSVSNSAFNLEHHGPVFGDASINPVHPTQQHEVGIGTNNQSHCQNPNEYNNFGDCSAEVTCSYPYTPSIDAPSVGISAFSPGTYALLNPGHLGPAPADAGIHPVHPTQQHEAGDSANNHHIHNLPLQLELQDYGDCSGFMACQDSYGVIIVKVASSLLHNLRRSFVA